MCYKFRPVFRLAYNTNGLAHHRLLDALRLLAELGYEGIAITPDVGVLDPYDLDPRAVADARRWAEDLGLAIAIETGARFVLDAKRKHYPTLLEEAAEERARRIDFLRRCIDLAADLDAEVVSLWSGRSPDGVRADGGDAGERDAGSRVQGAVAPRERELPALSKEPRAKGSAVDVHAARERAWDRLVSGLTELQAYGAERGVALAFEPEPGMFIERPAGYEELVARLGSVGDTLGLCLDVGHLHCTGDLPAPDVIRRLGNRLLQVHLDDIRGGVHEHLMFGQGDLDLPGVLDALLEVGYDGLAAVELSRDSHRGAQAAAEALEHLHRALATGRRS